MARFFYCIEFQPDDEDTDDPTPDIVRGVGAHADVGMAIAGALGELQSDQTLDVSVQRLTEIDD